MGAAEDRRLLLTPQRKQVCRRQEEAEEDAVRRAMQQVLGRSKVSFKSAEQEQAIDAVI